MTPVFKPSALSQALLLALVAPASLAAPADPAAPATPATPITAVAAAPQPKQHDTVVVQAEIAHRNRTPDIAAVRTHRSDACRAREACVHHVIFRRSPNRFTTQITNNTTIH